MNRHRRRCPLRLTRVSDVTATPASPDFLTPVRSGLGEVGEADVSEIDADRLEPTAARQLSRRLDEIADARLRARAASRHKFVG